MFKQLSAKRKASQEKEKTLLIVVFVFLAMIVKF